MEGGVALSDGQRPAQRQVDPQTVRANFNQWPAVPVDQIGGRRDVVAKQPAGSSVLEIQLNLTDLLELGDMSRSIGRSASVMVTLETVSDTPADQDEPLFDNSTLEESEFYAEDNEEGGRNEL